MPLKVYKASSKPIHTKTVAKASTGSSSKSSGSSKSSSSSSVRKTTTTSNSRPTPAPTPNVDKVAFGKTTTTASAGVYHRPKPIAAATGRDPEPPKPEIKTPRNLIRDKERTARDVATEKDIASKTIEERRRELGTDRDPRVLGPYGIRNYKPEPYQRDGLDVAMDVGMTGAAIFGGLPGQIAAGIYESGKLVRDHIMQKEADKYNEQHKT